MTDSTPIHQAPALVIYAKDKDKVSDFYKRVLNLEIVESETGFILLQAGNLEIAIVRLPEFLANEIVISSPPKLREDTPIKPLFTVQSIEQARAEAIDAGGQLKTTDSVWHWRGALQLDGWDPEGNIFQLRQKDG